MEALKAKCVPKVSQYPRVAGSPALRGAIVGYLGRRFGATLDADREILPCAGAKEAIFHLPLALIDPAGDRRIVAFPDPGYPIYERGTAFAGGEALPLPLSSVPGELVGSRGRPWAGVLERDPRFRPGSAAQPHWARLLQALPREARRLVSAARLRGGGASRRGELTSALDWHSSSPRLLEVARERVLFHRSSAAA